MYSVIFYTFKDNLATGHDLQNSKSEVQSKYIIPCGFKSLRFDKIYRYSVGQDFKMKCVVHCTDKNLKQKTVSNRYTVKPLCISCTFLSKIWLKNLGYSLSTKPSATQVLMTKLISIKMIMNKHITN